MEDTAGKEKTVFELLGGIEGVRALADCFFETMSRLPEARRIRNMHPQDLGPTCEKFTLFLCVWLGGPELYKEKYGSLNLTGLHGLLNINKQIGICGLHAWKRPLHNSHLKRICRRP